MSRRAVLTHRHADDLPIPDRGKIELPSGEQRNSVPDKCGVGQGLTPHLGNVLVRGLPAQARHFFLDSVRRHSPSNPNSRSMAERQGFEPWIEFPLYTLSKRAPSATRPSLRRWVGFRYLNRLEELTALLSALLNRTTALP